MTALEFFKAEAAKVTAAKIEGKRRRAAIVEYQSATGKIYRFYWDGTAYRDRQSKEYARCAAYKFSGTYKAA